MEGYLIAGVARALVARALTICSGLGQCGNKWNYFFDGDGVVEKKICTRWRS